MKRIEVLDVWRSFCVLLMVLWHGVYDLALFGKLDMAVMESVPARAVAFLCAAGFILVSGVCARLSKENLRRGFFIFCVGLALSVVMELIKTSVAFGILQFFGVAMIAYSFLRGKTDTCERAWFPAACIMLFAATAVIAVCVRVPFRWLYPLGLRYEGFYSADYYPLFPWIFLFLLGTWLGGKVEKHRGKPIFNRHFHPALTFAGRHSLVIYIIHQPLMCLVLGLIFR
jgi:uncharacterized membrane protein